MSYYSIGPSEGYCMLDFWLIWILEAIRSRDEERAYKWTRELAHAMRQFYPQLKD